jgi:hypothetical protein
MAQNPFQAQYAVTDLVPGTQPTGAEAAEFIQGGISVQLSITQILAAAALLLPVAQTQATLGIGAINIAAKAVNFNAGNTDTQIPIVLPTGFVAYRVAGLFIANALGTLTTATCGLFTASGGGGVAIVTGGTAITVTNGTANTNNNLQSFTINNQNTQSFNATPLFFRVGTAEGVAATADVILQITPLL